MLHAGYVLLEVKEWGRWESSCSRGYLRYDVRAMRGVVGGWMFLLVYLGLRNSSLARTTQRLFAPDVRRQIRNRRLPRRTAVIFLLANPRMNSGID